MLLSRHSVGTYPENKLTCNLSGNIWPQSSQFAEPLWTYPGIKSGISVHELISTLKKKQAHLNVSGLNVCSSGLFSQWFAYIWQWWWIRSCCGWLKQWCSYSHYHSHRNLQLCKVGCPIPKIEMTVKLFMMIKLMMMCRLQKEFQANPESYNGAVRDNYSWSQSITDTDVRVTVSHQGLISSLSSRMDQS